MNTTLIEQSLASYQTIGEHLKTIEKSMHGHNSDAIVALSQELLRLQEQVKATDTALLEKVQADPSFREEPQLNDLIDLMRHIHQHNDKVTSQLRSIMVVHRDDLLKIRKGNTALQGYRPTSDRTGGRISIAN
jgi:ferritin